SLTPLLTVAGQSCVVPQDTTLDGFATGDLVEMTCDLVGGEWTLRKLEHEDDHGLSDRASADDDDDDDDDDHSGPGSGDDDDDDDDSGHGSGDDD
ncbi:MAG: hypothetical protein OEW31_12035, partial [Thermoleophilia bacterium]|nr:hypothetical protein [Thermoleophilia bacterium]